ncbi:hypothetical protein [Fuerstiella marisgermanici]|uniref:Uncharacterized protein n=1 Tax=Fuerstiella marisgermanici TaxID=1891926 RepID=A0A1P8WGX9_9PLAN|nr:hypothetical protein [Fuerstiella marisgermanici]APZ93277.1 hypothetical protein Fuma_02894 [Fuerstiella marisgermanici]
MNSETLQLTESLPTVVLIDKKTDLPAWGATVSGRRALLCFPSIEVAKSYRRKVVGTRKNGYRVKRLSQQVWMTILDSMLKQRIQFCSVVLGTKHGSVSKLQVPINSYLAHHEQSEQDADELYQSGDPQKL